jgi:hypothetical protein
MRRQSRCTYHAIELHLKAFLRLQGMTEPQLRHIGHNFPKLGSEAAAKGLQTTDVDRAVLDLMAVEDIWSRSRYLETGLLRLPEIKDLITNCTNLKAAVGAALEAAGEPVREPGHRMV